MLRLASKRQIKVDPQEPRRADGVDAARRATASSARKSASCSTGSRPSAPFDIVNLPYTLLIGLAAPLKRALSVPICCTLQGEDLFLDGLGEPYRQQSLDLIRAASAHVDAFLPVSEYYRDYMPGYLGVPAREDAAGAARHQPGRLRAARAVRRATGARSRSATSRASRPRRGCTSWPTLPGCARVRGLRRRRGSSPPAIWRPSTGRTSTTSTRQMKRVRAWRTSSSIAASSIARRRSRFLQSLDVMSVPATYAEPKGIFLLEAMANGVPVVQPRRGAFPEIIEKTGGGLHRRCRRPGRAGRRAARRSGTIPARAPRSARAGAAGSARALHASGGWPKRSKSVYRERRSAASADVHRRGADADCVEHLEVVPDAARASCRFCPTSRSRSSAATPWRSWVRPAAARARCSTSSARSNRRRPGT